MSQQHVLLALTAWQDSPFSAVLGLAAVLSLVLASVVWRRRAMRGAVPFALLLLAAAEWAGMAALEHAVVSPAAKIFCAKLEYPGILSVSPLWLTFALAYTERSERLSPRRLALLWVIPLVTLALVWTNEWHRLVWTDITPSSGVPGARLVYGHGAWFWLAASYGYLLNLLGAATLVRALVRFPRQYRPQSVALVAGLVFPWIGNGIYLGGASPLGIDTTPLAFTLTGLVYAWGVFRLQLFDLVPVARHVLIERMADGVLVLDARNRIIDINPSARSMLGIGSVSVGERAEEILAAWPDLVTCCGGESERREEVGIEKADGPWYLDLQISPLADRHGRFSGRLVVCRDITARRLAEEQLRQTLEELRATQARLLEAQTLRALGELASGMAHHLNNLLSVILGRVELFLTRPESVGPARLEAVRRAALDASEVVRRVLRFTQRERLAEAERVNLSELAREVAELLRPRWRDEAELRGIRIEVGLELGEVPAVVGEPAALREAIMNLVINAVEALPEGGRVIVRTWSAGPWVHCSVADSGPGIPEDIRARVLEPFFTTKGVKSTGLGLSVNYGIVRQHGGDVTIESPPGGGTIMTIQLPAAPDEEGQPPVPAHRPPARRVLLIEDEPQVRRALADLLATDGHHVIETSSGREGLARLQAGEAVDLVLTDLGMPEMTGSAVARQIRERWPGLPVGILTGWPADRAKVEDESRAVAVVIEKPVTLDALRRAIGRLGRDAG